MNFQNDLVRLGISIGVYLGLILLTSNIHQKPYMNLFETIHIGSVITLLASIYFYIFVYIRRGWTKPSQYKHPFTFYNILVYVYGLGILFFVAVYCLFFTTLFCTVMFIIGLIIVQMDDIGENREESRGFKGLKFLSTICALITMALFTMGNWDHIDEAKILFEADMFQIMFMMVLPAFLPIIFYLIRSTYPTTCKDNIVDLLQCAMPFASIIACILLTVFHSCLNPTLGNSQNSPMMNSSPMVFNIPCLVFAPVFALAAFYLLMLFAVTNNTVDAIVSFTLAAAMKHLYLHPGDYTSVPCFLMADTMLLFRVLFGYYRHKEIEEESRVRLETAPETDNI